MDIKDVVLDLPTTAVVNLKADRVAVVQGGVLKQMSPETFMNKNPGVGVASDTLVDLSGKDTNASEITGTTAITSIVLEENKKYEVTFTDSLLLTYNATDLPLPGNTDILTMPGDKAILVGGAGDVAYVQQYIPAAVQDIPRVTYITSDPTPTPDWDTTDKFFITALNEGGGCSFVVPSGTPRDGQEMEIRITAAHAATSTLAFPSYLFIGCASPTLILGDQTIILNIEYHTTFGVIVTDVRDEYDPVLPVSYLVPATTPIVAVTDAESPRLLDAMESGNIFTNDGTADNIIFILPASAGCTAGKTRFSFYNLDTTSTYKNSILVAGTDHLYFISGTTALNITGGGVTYDNNQCGAFMTVLYQGGGIWMTEAMSQNWS